MNIENFKKHAENFGEGLNVVGKATEEKTKAFHEKYVTKVLPDTGKYGDQAKFIAEIAPGVSEYNAAREGDWNSFAISTGIDIGSVALGAVTAGAGYAAIKSGTIGVKAVAKATTKEIAEAGAKKVVKESVETSGKKVVVESTKKVGSEAAENVSEKVTSKITNNLGEKSLNELPKAESRIIREGIDKTKFPKYIDHVENSTNLKITKEQKELLYKKLDNKNFKKLDTAEVRAKRMEFNKVRPEKISEWENHNDSKWPTYKQDVVNEKGNVLRKKDQPYDAHHLIELSVGGPNDWYNLHPASYPYEHQHLIHTAEVTKELFGN